MTYDKRQAIWPIMEWHLLAVYEAIQNPCDFSRRKECHLSGENNISDIQWIMPFYVFDIVSLVINWNMESTFAFSRLLALLEEF